VEEYVPLVLSKKDGSITTQYTMTTLEELGLLKMDFLGLRNLTVIDDCVKIIQRTAPDFDIEKVPEDDAKTFDLLSKGKTLGVFQMESTGITSVCTGLGPKSIEDITAIIALYRPGPMDSIPRFLASAKDAGKITYKHPLLEPILSVTYGCIVYQEQVIEILRRLAGFSLGQADMIRRAMSKKKLSQIEKEKETFINGDAERGIEGAVSRGVAPAVAQSIYNEILDFANYAFNKAHAVCYAVVTYRTAYLKAHYPREYFAALLTSVLFLPEKVAEYAAECRELGIELLPPDINKSLGTFSVEDGNIRFGLTAVKNLGSKFMENVVSERQNGEFRGFGDFIRRMFGTDLNRRAVEALVKCGAFDCFGHKRTQLIAVTELLLNQETEKKRRVLEGQMSLFGGGAEDPGDTAEPVLPELPDFTAEEKASQEFEATGLYLSGHPCDAYRAQARERGAVPVGEILRDPESYADRESLVLLGTITASKTRLTKKGTQMCAMTADDGTGSMEVLAFEKVIVKTGSYMSVGNTVLITGRLSVRAEGDATLMADDVTPAAHLGAEVKTQQGAKVYLRLPGEDSYEFTDISKRITMFPGKDKLICVFPDKKQRSAAFSARIEFIEELREILGAENVVVKNGD
ncbi:MAG: DNA polymerase III subunit alpha, partial [Oscillospiraceae bacterium]|nr:DNA polymerase III subunit alpha [Oscillospiraceae bacterium]